jgi:DnaJ-class molecular chaperone
VSPKSSIEEIKTSYRQLILKHHPDKGGDLSVFLNLKTAYDVLRDPDKRKKYDELNTLMKPKHPSQEQLNPNIHITIDVTLKDILEHKIYTITPTKIVECNVCRATGIINYAFVPCMLCDGNGVYNTLIGISILCEHCIGKGRVPIEAPDRLCYRCKGNRYLKHNTIFYVPAYHCVTHSLVTRQSNENSRIPKESSPIIIYYGQGNTLIGSTAGDLFVHLNEIKTDSDDFYRSYMDICYTKHLTLFDALYGLTFEIITLNNKKMRLVLSPMLEIDGTLTSKWFEQVVIGEGIENPENKSIKGNLKIKFEIMIPNHINSNCETKNLLKNLFLSSQQQMCDECTQTSLLQ